MNYVKQWPSKLNTIYQLLRITLGVLFIVVGTDKFFNILVHWEQFIGPVTSYCMPFSAAGVIRIFGIYQIFLGLLLFSPWVLFAAYMILATLLFIFLNLMGTKDCFIVVGHDCIMIVLAIIFIWFINIKKELS